MADHALTAEQRLEIREACERLALDYSHLADAGRMDEWAHLFADDGELVLFGQTYRGPAAIRAAVGEGRGAGAFTVHAITNHRIDVLGENAAEATCYILAFAGERTGDGPAVQAAIVPTVVGVYSDAYRRTPAGWRFARRAFVPLIATAQS